VINRQVTGMQRDQEQALNAAEIVALHFRATRSPRSLGSVARLPQAEALPHAQQQKRPA